MSAINPTAKNTILGRIRDALGERPAAAPEYASITRGYRQESAAPAAERIALFVDRLMHYQVGVQSSTRAAIPEAIAEIAARRGKQRLVVPEGLPAEWIPSSVAAVQDAGLAYVDLDRSEGVVTGCTLAIAETGTIVLTHAGADGRRAATLVPDYHLCVVFADQIVGTVPEAIRRLGERSPALITTISGPSATSDIEMTRIRGVHGPRTLDVVVVG